MKLLLILYLTVCYSQIDFTSSKLGASFQLGYSSDKNVASMINISFDYALLKDTEGFLSVGASIIPGASIGIKHHINNLFFTYSLSSFLLPNDSIEVAGPYHSIASGIKFKKKVHKHSNSWWNAGLICSYIDGFPFILPFINYEIKS